MSFDVKHIQDDFPILKRKIREKPLVYLDSAATSHKPKSVIDRIDKFYTTYNSNVHRGIHTLAEEATAAYEGVREKVSKFINSKDSCEVVFTKGTTDSINLVASAWGEQNIHEGDEILLSQMEHHSNFVPWMILAKKKGAVLRFIPVTNDGHLDLKVAEELISNKTKLVAVSSMSNVLGTINPVKQLIEMAHSKGVLVLLDAAQAVPHLPVDVQELDCDFLAFSSHKMLGPTGVGVLYAKLDLLNSMPPYQGGGEMISTVSFEDVTYNTPPHKFEAGTPNIAGVIGFGAAIDYLNTLTMEAVREHDKALTKYALNKLEAVPGLKLYGPRTVEERGATFSFTLDDIHPHDLGTALDHAGVATRAGHHCCMPLMSVLNVVATNRASFYVYNDVDDVDRLIEAIEEARRFFHGRGC